MNYKPIIESADSMLECASVKMCKVWGGRAGHDRGFKRQLSLQPNTLLCFINEKKIFCVGLAIINKIELIYYKLKT